VRIETKQVRIGQLDGKIVWICHYNRPDMHKKALRNLPPTKVIIRSNDELPKNKTVYYSASHFSPLSKKGLPLAKVISPVDNTGYRSRAGNELHVFDNEEECNDAWNTQLSAHMEDLDSLIENASLYWREEKQILAKALK